MGRASAVDRDWYGVGRTRISDAAALAAALAADAAASAAAEGAAEGAAAAAAEVAAEAFLVPCVRLVLLVATLLEAV